MAPASMERPHTLAEADVVQHLDSALLRQRLAQRPKQSSIKTLYGHSDWVEDLDIINELGGHTGCVNALSWSKSGRLLASGSDDTHLNIWAYNPGHSAKPFTLSTCVATGHVANIFSTKFMPHSNDRTVVTCAGDSEVRVFDIERGGASGNASEDARVATTRSQRFQNFFGSARFLNDGNTNARVYKSHADRVKRIVTESSPYLFLTCSEDGEVRQWDLRQPSSAYPAPRGGQGFMSYRHGDEHDAGNVPPPLISYKRYNLDLNTISCAPSQPQYIALGGAHLHCFLHDRRMIGRDIATEQGRPSSLPPGPGSHEDELMGAATRCVKRFAPKGKPEMSGNDNGHITACKISDVNPNEMIVSWSGDLIYSFDIVQSPDARERETTRIQEYREGQAAKARRIMDRKRKRQPNSSTSLSETARARQALRREGDDDDNEIALRVRYGNGQSESIPLNSMSESTGDMMGRHRESLLSEGQKQSDRIAKALVRLRKTLFDLQHVIEANQTQSASLPAQIESPALAPYNESFTSTIGYAATLLPEMLDRMSSWRYPVDPSRDDVVLQKTMRNRRQASFRFVQAAGTLARVLGGKLRTLGDPENDTRLDNFRRIRPAPLERDEIDESSQFAYDFLKAILLWLEEGRAGLADGFTWRPAIGRFSRRCPLTLDDGENAIESKLIPYLSSLATDKPVINIDTSRFEVEENRTVFAKQVNAVQSFARAVADYDIGSSQGTSANVTGSREPLNRDATFKFWGFKVGRSLLMTAGEGVNYEFVNRAFGGIGINIEEENTTEAMEVERNQEDVDVNELDPEIATVSLGVRPPTIEEADEDEVEGATGESASHAPNGVPDPETAMDTENIATNPNDNGTSYGSESTVQNQDIVNAMLQAEDEPNEHDDGDDDDHDNTFASDSSDSDDEERIIYRSSAGFGRNRSRVETDTPCGSHTRIYKGHCNIKTVKDVNFYGLNDEYVISGSDDGNFFIWDKKTTKLLNILEGDGEVVNVIQGHPYEPMIAASGIDNTVKIFSPDARLQEEARNGENVADPGGVPASSLRMGRRTAPTAIPRAAGLSSRRRMSQQYQIMSQNDLSRRGGVGDAFLTRSMLARLAATINSGQAGVQGGQIVIDDNCSIM